MLIVSPLIRAQDRLVVVDRDALVGLLNTLQLAVKSLVHRPAQKSLFWKAESRAGWQEARATQPIWTPINPIIGGSWLIKNLVKAMVLAAKESLKFPLLLKDLSAFN